MLRGDPYGFGSTRIMPLPCPESALPCARDTMDVAPPSASAIFFAACACVVASSFRLLRWLDFRRDGSCNRLRHARRPKESKLLHAHSHRRHLRLNHGLHLVQKFRLAFAIDIFHHLR